MNLKSLKRVSRLLALAGAVAFALGIGSVMSYKGADKPVTGHRVVVAIPSDWGVQVADGSESTGKPPKPKNS